ncbi:MAG: ABC transporter permease [Candidatus Azobacteroides sp.]|nr:ABC transporter permease [Candidatus Azobacteroides sp.]
MLLHSLKMIWAERKSNGWILLELIVIFTILWFCSGFMYEKGKQFFEPIGFDIHHTYLLRFGIGKNVNIEDYSQDYDYPQDGLTIIEKLKQYPAIESACLSNSASAPYLSSYRGRTVSKDSAYYQYAYRQVSPEYFDVFKIKFQSGGPFGANEILSKNQVVASPEADNTFFKEDITSLKEIINWELEPGYNPTTQEEYDQAPKVKVVWKVTGVTDKIKRNEDEPYRRILFFPMKRNDFDPRQENDACFCIRVKPQADKNFIATFRKEMSEQLKIGPFELTSIAPLSESRTSYLKDTTEKIETMGVVILFLLVNVFLGIVGTFRFRANARRGEIGLRCALGSSKKKIRQLLLDETFLILLVASIPATILALNIQWLGILPKLGVSILEDKNPGEMMMFFSDHAILNKSMFLLNLIIYLITFVTMLIIIWLGTWYPAKKASEIQPAEALHYE